MRKGLKLSILLSLGIVLVLNMSGVSANQYSITVGATVETSGTATIYIPSGTYHLYVSVDADIGISGVVTCQSSIFSIAADDTYGSDYVLESQVTVNQSKEYTITVIIDSSSGSGFYANFVIILTDLDVVLLTKTSVIGEAPFAVEVILLAMFGIGIFFALKRKKQ